MKRTAQEEARQQRQTQRLRVRLPEPQKLDVNEVMRIVSAACQLTAHSGGHFVLSRQPIIIYHITAFGETRGLAYWPRNVDVGLVVMAHLYDQETRLDTLDVLMAVAYDDEDEEAEVFRAQRLGISRASQLGHVKEYAVGSDNNKTGVKRSQLDSFLYYYTISDLRDESSDSEEDEGEEESTE